MPEKKAKSMQELIERQVSALVLATAEAVCQTGDNVLEIEADLYEALAVNCADKHQIALWLAKGFGSDKGAVFSTKQTASNEAVEENSVETRP